MYSSFYFMIKLVIETDSSAEVKLHDSDLFST